MINELDALTEAEKILAEHWDNDVLPSGMRTIFSLPAVEVQPAQPEAQPNVVTFKDVVVYLLAALLLLAVLGMRL